MLLFGVESYLESFRELHSFDCPCCRHIETHWKNFRLN